MNFEKEKLGLERVLEGWNIENNGLWLLYMKN
jgi:hypothetical protein